MSCEHGFFSIEAGRTFCSECRISAAAVLDAMHSRLSDARARAEAAEKQIMENRARLEAAEKAIRWHAKRCGRNDPACIYLALYGEKKETKT